MFGGGPGGGLATVSLAGGPPEVLLQPQALSPDVRFGWPDALPDGAGLLFTVLTPTGSDVAILDAGASRHRVLVRDAAFGRYAPTGHLVVERRGQLAAAPFDLARRSLTGALRPVVSRRRLRAASSRGRDTRSRDRARSCMSRAPPPVHWQCSGARRGRGNAWECRFERRVFVRARVRRGRDGADGAMPAPEAVNPAGPGGLEVAFAANKTGPYNLFVRPLTGGAK